jgi:hypothetical protein
MRCSRSRSACTPNSTALQWRDVDLVGNRLAVRASKTDAGMRQIDLLPALSSELAAYKQQDPSKKPRRHAAIHEKAAKGQRQRSDALDGARGEHRSEPKNRLNTGLPGLCPRQESNLDLPLRRRSSYPLDYEGAADRAWRWAEGKATGAIRSDAAGPALGAHGTASGPYLSGRSG